MRRVFLCLFCLFYFSVTLTWADQEPSNLQTPSKEEAQQFQLLSDGVALLKGGNPHAAIDGYFDKIIDYYQTKFKGTEQKLFSARTLQESLMYLGEGINKHANTLVIPSTTWATAYYTKAYALGELGRISEAKEVLEHALALSPRNSQYLSELGNIYQRQKNWSMAIQTFQLAEAAAREFSPADLKNIELSRAWRGLGYAYVEQNRLDDAEKIYQQCVDLDQNDSKAKAELRYIEQLRSKQPIAPPGAQNSGSSSLKAPSQTAPTAVFLFGRANYFRAIVKVRKCDFFDAGAFAAINQRFENARLQLAARYGVTLFPADKPSGQVREGECDRVTLDSYSNHVAEIEQFLKSQS
ncbi:tetratricopeptide repeat protein [Collimonas humicola]|uniref:tetratricopeptide repeat protein n=1 Tax=Collimonas humicola TaxID=2825886 RepID=UPI001B8BD929|nr:tetratricopeptide repeat protein [Collimonas humicola]